MMQSYNAVRLQESVVNAIKLMNIADIGAYPRKGLWTEGAARDRLRRGRHLQNRLVYLAKDSTSLVR